MAGEGRGAMTHRARVPLIATAVKLAIVAVASFRFLLSASAEKKGKLGELAALVGEHRLARARLTGGFAYAACQVDSASSGHVHGFACDGSPAKSWATTKRFREFAADIRGASNALVRLDAHTTGVWKLLWDQTEDAVADLREAVKGQPKNALALNDLSVALTRFAQQHNDPSALVDAFIAADSAARLDTSLVEVRFTHALVLENLYLRTDAIAAWNRYLELDSSSGWADEAREHLKALQPRDTIERSPDRLRRAVAASDFQTIRSIIAANPSDVRIVMHEELAAWGEAFARGDSAGARGHLNLVRVVADPFRAIVGDALVADAVAAIDRTLAKKDNTTARALADGHAVLAEGIKHLEDNDTQRASNELRDAHRLLTSTGSPMGQWALLYVARAESRKTDTALAYLNGIRDSAPAQYVGLRSAAAQYQGFVHHVRAEYLDALASYDTALAENRRMAEPSVALRAGSWKAEREDVLRGREAAWRTRYIALAASPRYPTSYQALLSLFDYAGRATETEAPRLSLRYIDESLRMARHLNASTAYMLRRRAELLARVGQTADARAVIADAFKAANGAQRLTEASRKKLLADLMLADARVASYSAPAEAVQKLRLVIDTYKATKYATGLPPAYLYLAQSMAASGAIEAARAAFDSATSLMERQRASITGYAEREAFLDAARSVIDQTVAFHSEHRPTDAFEFFEGNRSRVLLEQLGGTPEGTADRQPVLAALRRRLTNNDVVLSYAVLPRELLIWVVTRKGLEQHRVSITASELETLVDRFQRSLTGDSDQPADSSTSARLYQLLIASAGSLQRANLFIIPDRWLHFVPFVALQDPTSGRYLVRDHAVSYAPSATLLLSNLARPPQHFSQASKVLAVGNPAFDQRAFPLQTLPFAESEARRIASLYTVHNPLTGRDATDSTLQRMAPDFDILHFAGHAVVGRNAPQLSHLVLAPAGRSDGAVFSTEIARWKLPRTRLVVLSGCNTADGKLSATEGASSLARAFFTAGVPAVVSSLWAIEDDDTADFFVAFHERLVKGDSPAVALRETQIKWLGDGRKAAHPIRSWAAFQLFGG
jgi:CHAT domain-containing protein